MAIRPDATVRAISFALNRRSLYGARLMPKLIGWIVFTTVAALSVHVFMFDVLRVAHPDNGSVPYFALFLNNTLAISATLVFYKLGRAQLDRWPFVGRCLLVAIITAMLGESLLRNIIMDGVVSNAWIYSLIENLTKPLQYLVTSIIIVAVAERSRTMVQLAGYGLAIAAAATFVFDPAIATLLDRLTASFEYLDTGNIYNPPYGWQVDVPSYLTFVEPVVASFAIGFLVRDGLSPRPSAYTAQLIFLIMAMKGSILPTLLFSFFLKGGLASAILSESQFGLEIFVMAFLTAVGTRACFQLAAR